MHIFLPDSGKIPQLVSMHFILHRAPRAAYTISDPIILLLSNLWLYLTSQNSPPAPCVSGHLESLFHVPLCSKCPALVPPKSHPSFLLSHLTCVFLKACTSSPGDILLPLLACEHLEGQDYGYSASERVCSQAPRVGSIFQQVVAMDRVCLGPLILVPSILLRALRFFFEELTSLTQSACGLHGADCPHRGS